MSLPIQDNSSIPPFIELNHLFNFETLQDKYTWEFFRENVDIFRLYGDGISGPSAVLLRYRETTVIPPHVHEGYEHVIVLCGSQNDEYGVIEAGSMRVHAPGTEHHVTGSGGCIVLVIYEKPVRFL